MKKLELHLKSLSSDERSSLKIWAERHLSEKEDKNNIDYIHLQSWFPEININGLARGVSCIL